MSTRQFRSSATRPAPCHRASLAWAVVAVRLVQARLQAGQPWMLAAAILASVALLTLLAGVLLNAAKLKERYPA